MQLFEMLEAVAKALDRPLTGAISDDDDGAVERGLQILQFVDVLHKQVPFMGGCAVARLFCTRETALLRPSSGCYFF